MPTPPPTKKARTSSSSDDGTTLATDPSVKSKYGLLEQLFGKDSEEIPSDTLDRFMMQCIELKQSRTDNKGVFNHKNFKNGKETHYVKMSVSTTDEGFAKHSGWVDECFKINGMKDSAYKSANRTTKKIRKRYGEAFKEALEEEGVKSPEKMSSFKIAAMYHAANISGRKCRRELMKHLRKHFGKHCFEPEYKVQMLCDGHTTVTS